MNILVLLKPKSQVEYIDDDFTIRQTLEKLQHHHYAAIPIIDKSGQYIATISEGDILWYIKEQHNLTYKSAERINIMSVPRHHNNVAINSSKNIEDLVSLAINQNFIPVVDDLNRFIGIVTRKSIIEYCFKEMNLKGAPLSS